MKKLLIILMFGFGKLQSQTLFTSHGITQIKLNDTTFVAVKRVNMGGFYNYYSYKDGSLVADDSTGDLFLYQKKHWGLTMKKEDCISSN